MQIIKDITLDLNRGISHSYIEVHQGETGGRYLRAKIERDGKPFEIPETFVACVDACLCVEDKKLIVAEDVACEINPDEGDTSIVLIPITKLMCAKNGKVEISLKFIENASLVMAQTVRIVVLKNIVEGAEYDENADTDIAPKIGIYLSDRVTAKKYCLYVSDGKLMLEQSEE